ncbi:MAG: hypothetical protein ACRC4M_04945 [Mycoplasma sp.]
MLIEQDFYVEEDIIDKILKAQSVNDIFLIIQNTKNLYELQTIKSGLTKSFKKYYLRLESKIEDQKMGMANTEEQIEYITKNCQKLKELILKTKEKINEINEDDKWKDTEEELINGDKSF